MTELVVPRLDFSPLGNLAEVYREASNRRDLSDLGEQLANGTVDYRQAAGRVARMGNLDGTLRFLGLAEAQKKQAAELAASQNFNDQMGGIFGQRPPVAAAGQPQALPSADPQSSPLAPQAGPVAPPTATARPPVQPSPKVWGDAEAEAAGLYEPTGGKPAAAAPMSLTGLGGKYGQQPQADQPQQPQKVAQATAPQSQGFQGINASHIPQLVGAISSPHLPAAQKELAGKLLTRALDDSKPNEKIQMLTQLKEQAGYPGSILDLEKELRSAGKTTVNVDTKGQTAFATAAGGSVAKRFEELSKEGDSAQTDLALVGQLRDLGNVVKTGGPAAMQGWLAGHGIKVGDNVGATEAYSAIIDKLTPAQRIPGSGSTSDYDAKMFKGSLPRLINTPEGNKLVESTLAGLAQYKIDRARIAEQGLTGELTPAQTIKALRDLPNPYANFKAYAERGFKADPNAKEPANPEIPRNDPQRPQPRTRNGVNWSVE